ncbi:hypothetical protein [Winogradskyella poriferorum]|uniref:Uncharacterized protein n=1 Tax=Winogradskyella poriferorum TaxID=307627 RepID=A0ABU7W4J9_9FLAO
MKKVPSLFILLIVTLVFSCSTDQSEINTTNDENLSILSLNDMKEFQNLLITFNNYNSIKQFEDWSEKQAYITAYSSDKISQEELNNIPFTFQFILNEDKKFRIGEREIEFRNGIFYEVSNISSDNKNEIVFAKTEVINVDDSQNTDPSKTTLNANGGEYKEWTEFVRQTYASGCSAPINKSLRYRLVHYLEVIKTTGPSWGFSQTDVYFKLRMSQKKSSGWHYNNTSTERLYTLNLTGNTTLKYYDGSGVAPMQNFSIYDSNSCSNTLKGTKSYWIRSFSLVTGTNFSLYNWDINVNGLVFHKVNGDTNEINTTISW